MGLFDKVSEITKNATEKAGSTYEVTKLKLKINDQEKAINEKIIQLGTWCLAQAEAGAVLEGEGAEICAEIAACKKAIADIEAEIAGIKSAAPAAPAEPAPAASGKKFCSGCGTALASDAKFCHSCGAKQE